MKSLSTMQTMSFDFYNYFNFLNFSPIFDEVVEDHVLVFYEGIGQQGKERYFGKRKRYAVTCISVIEIIICVKRIGCMWKMGIHFPDCFSRPTQK